VKSKAWRVIPGRVYKYNPVGWDILDPKTSLKPGDLVRVKNKILRQHAQNQSKF